MRLAASAGLTGLGNDDYVSLSSGGDIPGTVTLDGGGPGAVDGTPVNLIPTSETNPYVGCKYFEAFLLVF